VHGHAVVPGGLDDLRMPHRDPGDVIDTHGARIVGQRVGRHPTEAAHRGVDKATQQFAEIGILAQRVGKYSAPPCGVDAVTLQQRSDEVVASTEVVADGGVIGIAGALGDVTVGHHIHAVSGEEFFCRVQ